MPKHLKHSLHPIQDMGPATEALAGNEPSLKRFCVCCFRAMIWPVIFHYRRISLEKVV